MHQASENTKKTSADFTRHFDFLTKEFGLKLVSESYSIIGGDTYTRILQNEYAQVELYGDQNYFHVKIRRVINGEPCIYEDIANNLGLGRLAALANNNTYNYADFYPAIAGWDKALQNTQALFNDSKELFTSGNWIDFKKTGT